MFKRLRQISLRWKLALISAFCLILLVTVSMVALLRMTQMNDITTLIVTRPLPGVEQLGLFNSAMRGFRTTDFRYVIAPDAGAKQKAILRSEEARRQAGKALTDYGRTLSRAEDIRAYRTLAAQWNAYLTMHRRLLPMIQSASVRTAALYLDGPMRDQFLKVEARLDAMMEGNRRYGLLLQAQAEAAYKFSRFLVIGLFLSALVTGIAASCLLTRNVNALMTQAQRQSAQEALAVSEQRFRALVANASDVIAIVTAEQSRAAWRYLSPAAEAAWGYAPDALIGMGALELVHSADVAHMQSLIYQAGLAPKTNITGQLRLRRADGGWRSCEVIVSNQQQEAAVGGLVFTFHDVTERKAYEEQITHQAFHDALTGLPNRLLFQDRLTSALKRMARLTTGVAVLFVDLDNFKFVNDSLGHEAGDILLQTVAQRLQAAARSGDTIARLGGDEFTLLLENIRSVEEATCTAERIIAHLQQPIALDGREVFASASVGVAFSSDDGQQAEDLLRDADTAMYQAKSQGKSDFVIFNARMNADAVERMEIETGLRGVVERGELRVHYQPLVDLASGCMNGVEALVRWEHPTRGLLPPGKFIAVAEETGAIIPIGYWVLEEACRQMQAWKAACPHYGPFTVNVNLSGKQLQRPDVVERVAVILTQTGIAPSDVKLEITESVMMADVEDTVAKLHALKGLGVKLALDDFGTGYSSMASLNLFPLDTVKIDRAFIKRLSEHHESASIVAAIVMLSKALHLDVTGEGVETAEHVTQLQELGCQMGQGYFFARPLPAADLMNGMAAGPHHFAPMIQPPQAAGSETITPHLRAA